MGLDFYYTTANTFRILNTDIWPKQGGVNGYGLQDGV